MLTVVRAVCQFFSPTPYAACLWQVGVDVEAFARQHGPSSTYISWSHSATILASLGLPTGSFDVDRLKRTVHTGVGAQSSGSGPILIESDEETDNHAAGNQSTDSAMGSSRKRCLSQDTVPQHSGDALESGSTSRQGQDFTGTASAVLSKILRQSYFVGSESQSLDSTHNSKEPQGSEENAVGLEAVDATPSSSAQPSRMKKKRSNDLDSDLAALHNNSEAVSEMRRTMSPDHLVQLLRSASVVIAQKSEREKELVNMNKALKKTCNQLSQKTGQLQDLMKTKTVGLALRKVQKIQQDKMDLSALELKTTGKSGKRLSAESVLALGTRRNFSNIAACDFGSTVLFPVSHQTVTRCEVRAASAIKASFQCWVQEKYDICKSVAVENDPNTFTIMGILIRADATNTNIWRRQKLHVCEAAVGFLDDSDNPLEMRRCLQLGYVFLLEKDSKNQQASIQVSLKAFPTSHDVMCCFLQIILIE